MNQAMNPLPRVQIGQVTFFVDAERPVGLLRRPDAPDQFLSWAETDTGIHSPQLSLHPARNALWLCYQYQEDDDLERYPALRCPARLTAIRLDPDGGIGSIQADQVKLLGVTSHGLWTGTSLVQNTDENYEGGELPDSFIHPDTLQLHRPQQATLNVSFDRHVDLVRETARGVELWLNPSPPLTHAADDGGASYEYRCSVVPLPPLEQLKTQLRFRDLVPAGWGRPVEMADFDRLEAEHSELSGHDPEGIDLAGVPGVSWKLVRLSDAQREQAVAATAEQFTGIEQYWHGAAGEVSPLSQGVADARVEVIGSWPATRVEVSFTHPHYPAGRMRRTFEIFDNAGRIRYAPYAAIHLMEDLDTLDLPAPSEARQGFLEI